MKTLYVFDSSVYYVTKLMSSFVNKKDINFSFISMDNNLKDKEIIYIVNDTNDFIEYLVVRENCKKIHLVITNVFLIKKLSLTNAFDFYTYDQFEKYLATKNEVK